MRDRVIHTRVTEKQYQELRELAKIRKQNMSELIRVIIWLFVDRFGDR